MSRMADNPKGKGFGVHLDQGKVHVNVTSNWADDAIRVETERVLEPKAWHHIAVTYSGSRMAEGVRVYIDGRREETKVLLDTLYRPFRNAGKPFTEPFRIGAGWGRERRFRGRIDEVRVYDRVLDDVDLAVLALGESVNDIARKPESQRSAAERFEMRSAYLAKAAPPEIRKLAESLDALLDERAKLESSFPTVMVMAEANPIRRDTFLLLRGAYDHPGEKVTPGVPAVLPPLAGRRAEQPARVRRMAGGSPESSAGARDREPLLADVFRHRHREDGGGFRFAGRVAFASRVARLAGHRIRADRLGRQGHAED